MPTKIFGVRIAIWVLGLFILASYAHPPFNNGRIANTNLTSPTSTNSTTSPLSTATTSVSLTPGSTNVLHHEASKKLAPNIEDSSVREVQKDSYEAGQIASGAQDPNVDWKGAEKKAGKKTWPIILGAVLGILVVGLLVFWVFMQTCRRDAV